MCISVRGILSPVNLYFMHVYSLLCLAMQDYIHRVICVTEREKFEVPIRAIGARAILDLPDRLHFPISPVKCTAQKTLLVRNIGNCEAKFQLSTCRLVQESWGMKYVCVSIYLLLHAGWITWLKM